jgi:hypothetical protein
MGDFLFQKSNQTLTQSIKIQISLYENKADETAENAIIFP